MLRPPPRSTRTDTRFPYPTLFRSRLAGAIRSQQAKHFSLLHLETDAAQGFHLAVILRSEEHTSELQSLMRISYAVFCLKKKKHTTIDTMTTYTYTRANNTMKLQCSTNKKLRTHPRTNTMYKK